MKNNISIYVSVFILILFMPIFAMFFNIQLRVDEKRINTKKPDFSFNKNYPNDFEEYYNDNFGLRSFLIDWNSRIKIDYFRTSPKPESVLFGKNGFLFYNEKSDAIYDSYSRLDIEKVEDIALIYEYQKIIKEKLASKNIKYFIGFFPNKHTIYIENLPFSMINQIQDNSSLSNQLVSYFERKNFPFIDVTKELLMEKKNNQLYYKFDTHWNNYGAYIGYKSICNQTFKELQIKPFETNFFKIKYSKINDGDLVNMIGIREMEFTYDEKPNFELKNKKMGYVTGSAEGFPKNTVMTTNKNCKNKKIVIVFRDSFTDALIQFLSLHFYKAFYVNEKDVNFKLIEKVKPNIVISLRVERYLKLLKTKVNNSNNKL